MNKNLLALYGLKWNPFSPELPTEALYVTPKVENFCWRIEHSLVREGGFALIAGDPGTGKSVVLRLLARRLESLRELSVGAIIHPSGKLADFYRERQGNCSVSSCDPITAGADSRPCATAGWLVWRGRCSSRSCSSTRRRRCILRC